MLEPHDVQEALAEIDLIPAQADQFGHAQAMTSVQSARSTCKLSWMRKAMSIRSWRRWA